MAYSEQVGTKRHDGGNIGEIAHLYPRSRESTSFCKKLMVAERWSGNGTSHLLLRKLLNHLKGPRHFPAQFRKIHAERRFLEVDHHIHRGHAFQPLLANRLPQPALHPISFNRPPERSSHRETGPHPRILSTDEVKHRKVGGKMPPAQPVHPLKIRMAQQSDAARECQPLPGSRWLRTAVGSDTAHWKPPELSFRNPF